MLNSMEKKLLLILKMKQSDCRFIIAADGIHSAIRKKLVPNSEPRYSGYTCWRGITENNRQVDEFTSTEIWSSIGRFGMAPMKNGQVYWFACINARAKDPFYQHIERNEIANLFQNLPDSSNCNNSEHTN